MSMQTVRQTLREALGYGPRSSLELSRELGLPEKEILAHLAHLARAPGAGWRFHLTPAQCKSCGFVFAKRERLTPPSRCPLCKGQSIRRPRYAMEKIGRQSL
jgi:predicted Zn-ribbon and HTH transcriptional regulator